MLKVITVAHDMSQASVLMNSLQKHGWSAVGIETPWKGFGTKLIATYEYLKDNPEVDSFIFCDAFDVICFGDENEFKRKILYPSKLTVSAEKSLWPPIMQPFRKLYPYGDTIGFNFPNSGCYYSSSSEFIRLFEKYKPFYEIDDQFWMHMLYLNNEICLDNYQSMFNSHSFIEEGEYEYSDGRITIVKTGIRSTFVHCNGRTVDEKLNQLLV